MTVIWVQAVVTWLFQQHTVQWQEVRHCPSGRRGKYQRGWTQTVLYTELSKSGDMWHKVGRNWKKVKKNSEKNKSMTNMQTTNWSSQKKKKEKTHSELERRAQTFSLSKLPPSKHCKDFFKVSVCAVRRDALTVFCTSVDHMKSQWSEVVQRNQEFILTCAGIHSHLIQLSWPFKVAFLSSLNSGKYRRLRVLTRAAEASFLRTVRLKYPCNEAYYSSTPLRNARVVWTGTNSGCKQESDHPQNDHLW